MSERSGELSQMPSVGRQKAARSRSLGSRRASSRRGRLVLLAPRLPARCRRDLDRRLLHDRRRDAPAVHAPAACIRLIGRRGGPPRHSGEERSRTTGESASGGSATVPDASDGLGTPAIRQSTVAAPRYRPWQAAAAAPRAWGRRVSASAITSAMACSDSGVGGAAASPACSRRLMLRGTASWWCGRWEHALRRGRGPLGEGGIAGRWHMRCAARPSRAPRRPRHHRRVRQPDGERRAQDVC